MLTSKNMVSIIDSVKESYETDAEAKYYDYVDKHESKLQKRRTVLKPSFNF